MNPILFAVIVVSVIGLIGGIVLSVASVLMSVPTDENIEKIREELPGANCGGCGYPGCDGMAAALVEGKAEPTNCKACSSENLQKIGKILGIEVEDTEQKVARLICRGSVGICQIKGQYDGYMDCKAAAMVVKYKSCKFACLGLGSCTKACPFHAIKIGDNGIPEIDESICVGCGKCAETCPVSALQVLPVSQTTFVVCRNPDFGKKVMNVCGAGCIGCKLCMKVCENDAISVENNLPVIDPQKCIGCGKCAQACKTGALRYIGKEGTV